MSRLIQPFRELGFLPGFFYLADRAAERLFGTRIFYLYSIVAQPVVPPRLRAAKEQITLVCTTWNEVEAYASKMTANESMIRERFARNYICVLLAKESELLAYAWLSREDYIEDEVRCLFTPLPEKATSWDFDVYILPQHRGTLVFARLWDAVNQYLSLSGRSWSVSRISTFNTASVQSHKSLGAVRCINILFVVIGQVQIMLSPHRPFLHVSLTQRSTPGQTIDIRRYVDVPEDA
jgi:hypothetical protein